MRRVVALFCLAAGLLAGVTWQPTESDMALWQSATDHCGLVAFLVTPEK